MATFTEYIITLPAAPKRCGLVEDVFKGQLSPAPSNARKLYLLFDEPVDEADLKKAFEPR